MKNFGGLYNRRPIWSWFVSGSRSLSHLQKKVKSGEIVFSKDTKFYLFGCSLAEAQFAENLIKITGAEVIAGKGKVSPEIIKIERGGKKVKVETGRFIAEKGWYLYKAGKKEKYLGKIIEAPKEK